MRSLALLSLLLPSFAMAQGFEISPTTEADLENLLRKLGERHRVEQWCTGGCATFYEMRFDGSLARGEIRFSLNGAVTSDKKAYVPLFGTRPSASLDQASGRPLFWSGNAYATVLDPGEFSLSGSLRFPAGAPVTLIVPGPVGQVELDVTDADVVGTGERRGVTNATYQLTPKQQRSAEQEGGNKERLRLQVARSFNLARDRTFTVSISARGAKPGQVIPVALVAGEAVEDLPAVATLREEGNNRWLDWVASGQNPSMTYGGKWQAESIELEAPAGAVKETWRVRCDDPYLCSFEGDAEKLVGETGHVWAPLPGQSLEVAWRELDPLKGVHTVAQEVALATKPVGRNLQQRLRVGWMSSSGSLVSLTVPEEALISRFELDGAAVPILKDKDGAIQVSLPAGRSTLEADWEISSRAGSYLRPPVPRFSEPVGTLWHRIYAAEGTTVLKTGGLAGSPRVALWPSMGACLAIAALLWLLARWGQRSISSPTLLLIAILGFAIAHPVAAIPLALALGIGRWLSRIQTERWKIRILFELGVWGGLTIAAVVIVFTTLHHALFAADPMEVTSFVSGGQVPGAESWGWDPLIWGTYLAGDPSANSALPAPWIIAVPVVVVRLLWAAWAVVTAIFLVREGKLAVEYLTRYWHIAKWIKPRPAKPASPPPPAPGGAAA